MKNDRKSLFRFSRRELKFALRTTSHPAIGGQKKPGRECGLARIAVLEYPIMTCYVNRNLTFRQGWTSAPNWGKRL
jgi:hypothetical protein